MRGKLLFLLNIVISRRASVTAMIVQLHFDRRRRVFGIFLTRSNSYSRWAHLQHILDLLTTNHSDHGPVKWQCLSSLDYDAEEQFWLMSCTRNLFSRVKREFLKWAFAAIKMFLRWEKTLVLKSTILSFFRSLRPLLNSLASLSSVSRIGRNSMRRNFQNWSCRLPLRNNVSFLLFDDKVWWRKWNKKNENNCSRGSFQIRGGSGDQSLQWSTTTSSTLSPIRKIWKS